jgi:HK97 family phage portal protein
MFNPLALFKKKSSFDVEATVDNIVSGVWNAGGNALTWKQMFGNLNPKQMGSNSNQLKLSAIYCAVNMYIGSITSLPRFSQRIEQGSGRPVRYVKTTEHPASRIWSHYANDELSADDLMKLMIHDVLWADGNFYALKHFDSQNRVARITYIHPTRCPRGNIRRAEGGEKLSRGIPAKRGELIYIIQAGEDFDSDEALYLSKGDVVHIKGNIPDPEYYRSMGVLENNARSAGLYNAAEEMGSKFYSRGYTNQMFLSTESKLSPKARQGMEDLMNNATADVSIEDMFKTRILEQGLKPVHVGMPLEQMQFIETRAFSVEDVGRWFSIPPALLHMVMGTKTSDPDYAATMSFWVQNGLGNTMSCIANGFRDNILPRASQPLFRFDFNRLHLYKTILSDFSAALRNLFEIGAIDRLTMSELLGVFLDPADTTNTQRYVPANLVTVDHSLSLEEKAKKSIDVMDQQLQDMELDRGHKKESHEMGMETQKKINEGMQDPNKVEKPGEDPNDQSQDDSNQDKKTRAVPPRDSNPEADNLTKLALYNTLKGLNDYQVRVIDQKAKSRPHDFSEALNEWNPKFQEKVTETLNDWKPVIDEIDNFPTMETWTTLNFLGEEEVEQTEVSNRITNNFNELFSFLKGESE